MVSLIANNQFDEFKDFFLDHTDIYSDRNKFYSPIDCAVISGNEEIFRFLKINGVQETKNTCRLAVISGNFDIINILNESGLDFSQYLLTAIEFHHNEIADWILTNFEGKDLNPSFCLLNLNLNAYCYCAYNKIGDVFTQLLQLEFFDLAKISFEARTLIDNENFQSFLNPLNEKVFEFLCDNRYKMNLTQLNLVIETGNFHIFEIFYKKKLLKHIKQQEILSSAIRRNNYKVIEFMLSKGIKIDYKNCHPGISRANYDVFSICCSNLCKSDLDHFLLQYVHHIDVCKLELLIEKGANVNATIVCKAVKSNKSYEESALIKAIKGRNSDAVKCLIDHGA